jgi:hypothetical protein
LTATDNWRGSAKFPNFVVGGLCVWLNLDTNGSLLLASNCEMQQLSCSCLSARLYRGTAGLTANGVSRLLKSEYCSNMSEELKLRVNMTVKMAVSHEDYTIFCVNCSSMFLIIGNVSEKVCREN